MGWTDWYLPAEKKRIRCENCFGTGTVFPGKILKVGNSKQCPVCKGSCTVEAPNAK